MPYTYGDLKNHVIKLLDELSSSGNVQTTQDVLVKIATFANDALYDLASTSAKIADTFNIVLNPVMNEVGYDTSTIKKHLPGAELVYERADGKSYYFEAYGVGEVVVEEEIDGSWVEIETVTVNGTIGFTEYRKNITRDSESTSVRLRFTGNYPYDFRNYILYPYAFSSNNGVQQHKPYFEYALPSNFLKLSNVMIRRDVRSYAPFADYIISADKKMAVNRYYAPCEISVHYWRRPEMIVLTGEGDDDIVIESAIGEDALRVIPYFVAGNILRSEADAANGLTLINMYESKKAQLVPAPSAYQSSIISVNNW